MKVIRWSLMAGLTSVAALAASACERKTEVPREPEARTEPESPVVTDPVRRDDERPDGVRERTGGVDEERSAADYRGTPGTVSDRAALAERRGNETAVSAITAARCDREQRCNNIGAGKKYESREACVTQVRADWREDLSALECPRGVIESKLSECVTKIKQESCANPFDRMGSGLSCGSSDLCTAG